MNAPSVHQMCVVTDTSLSTGASGRDRFLQTQCNPGFRQDGLDVGVGGWLYMCLTEATNATLVGGQRHSEVHSRLILLSIAVAAGDKHYGVCDARHHSVL